MEPRVQLVAVVVSTVLLVSVLDLVRRKRMLERYALLWLASALVLLGLSVWRGLLDKVAGAIGVAYAPSALFLIAFGVVMVLLLHFSIAVSHLADQSRVLAQRLALLEERQASQARPRAVPDLRADGAGEGSEELYGQYPEESRARLQRSSRR